MIKYREKSAGQISTCRAGPDREFVTNRCLLRLFKGWQPCSLIRSKGIAPGKIYCHGDTRAFASKNVSVFFRDYRRMDFENPDFKESSTGVQYQRLTPYQQRRKRPSHSFIMTMDPSPPRQPLLLFLSLLLLAISWQHTPNVHAFGVVPPTPRRLQQHQQQHQSQQFRLVLSSSSSSDNNAAAAAAPAVTIVDQVTQQMKISMKAKDTTTLATIRLIRSAFANAAKLGCRLVCTAVIDCRRGCDVPRLQSHYLSLFFLSC